MRKFLLVCIAVSMAFASYEAFEKARFTFPHKVLNVERHYFEDRWIHEVTCSNYVYLIIDDTVDTNYVENIYKGDVLACGDSIVAVTKRYEETDTFCSFHKIYPDDRYVDEWLGKDFNMCLWSDSLDEILYLEEYVNYYHTSYAYHSLDNSVAYGFDGGTFFRKYQTEDGVLVVLRSYKEFGDSWAGYEWSYALYQALYFTDGVARTSYEIGKQGWKINFWTPDPPGIEVIWRREYTTWFRPSLLDYNGDEIYDIFVKNTERLIEDDVDTTYGFRGLVVSDGTFISYPDLSGFSYFTGAFIDEGTPSFLYGNTLAFGDSLSSFESIWYPDSEMWSEFDGLCDYDSDSITDLFIIDMKQLSVVGFKRSYELFEGWNLLSPSYILADSLLSTIFPRSLPGYFQYSSETHNYVETDYFHQGKGVFVYGLETEPISLSGDQIETVSLDIREGWNMLGGPSHAVQASRILEDSMIVPPLYILNPATSTYEAAEVIYPGQGFWLLSTEDHVLEVE